MKLIDQYRELNGKFEEKLSAGKLAPEELCTFQELKYRICILETLRILCISAPVSTDTRMLTSHYQVVSAYLRFMSTERKLGTKADEDGLKKREAAAGSLERVMTDWAKRFGSFKPNTPELYKSQVTEYINAVLTVWIQYRNTYINI